MKRIIFSLLLFVSFMSQAQVRISELPEHTGNPNGGLLPLTISGQTRKFNAGNFLWNGGSYSNPSWLVSLAPNKLLQSGATPGQGLIWNGTSWTPGQITATVGTLPFQNLLGTPYSNLPLRDALDSMVRKDMLRWDSIMGRPANFSTTYALSNDVRDSILARARVNYVDSVAGLLLRRSDTLTFVRTFGNQSIAGRKTFIDSILGNNARFSNTILTNSLQLGDGFDISWGGTFGTGAPTIAAFQNWIGFYPNGNESGEAVRIDSLGRMGIGTSTPNAPLQVVGEVNSTIITATGQGNNLTVAIDSAITGTTYTLVLADAGKVKRCTNASGVTITIPLNSSVAFPIGTWITFRQRGGTITLSPVSGVTLLSAGNVLTSGGVNSNISLLYVATNTWDVYY